MQKPNRHNAPGLYFSDRLAAALERIPEYPLTVIEAPLGYGKTTAVKEYADRAGFDVLWQTVYDNTAAHFWKGFCTLFARLDSACALSLEEVGLPEDSAARRVAVSLIAGVTLKGTTILVIDDHHLLTTNAIHEFITYLAKNRLSGLHIVLTTRMASLEALDELKLKGLAQHINQKLLELTPDEITKYYKCCGVRLRQEEAATLYTYTEGWISALYLCLLSFLQDGRLEKPTNLQELLAKVVYRPLSDELKVFLLRLCLFDHFTLQQAQAMWQHNNAANLLRQLMNQNAFIQYDTRNQTYQMHNIFTGYLRELFGELAEEDRQEIWQAAGEWHVRDGDYLAAMEAYYQARDFDKLLAAVELDKGNSINNEHKEAIFRYFDECPNEISQVHPIAEVLYARELLIFGEMERFALLCQELDDHINQIADAAMKNWLAGEMELVLMFTKYNDIEGMADHVRKAGELLPGASKLCDNNTPWTLGMPSVLYMFYRESGALQQDVHNLLTIMPLYYKLTANHGSGVEHVMEAERYYYLGDFENAEIVCHKALRTGQFARQIGSVVCAFFLQVRLALARGNLAWAQKLLDEMRAEIKASRQVLYLHTADLCESFVYAHLKQADNIPTWVRTGDFGASRLLRPVLAYFYTIYGRVLLITGQERKLLGIAEHLVDTASFFPNLLGLIYANIYIAAANEKIFRRETALSSLQQAFELALPDGMAMPFVENADLIQPLLEELNNKGIYREETARILRLSAGYRQAIVNMKEPTSGTAAKAELTEREREIALWVADGLTNKEIAVTLEISENTVKTLLKRIFEKLGVNSRILLKEYFK